MRDLGTPATVAWPRGRAARFRLQAVAALRAIATDALHGSRAAELREAEQTRLPSCDANDDEVGGSQPSAIRASAARAINRVPPMGFEPMLERV